MGTMSDIIKVIYSFSSLKSKINIFKGDLFL